MARTFGGASQRSCGWRLYSAPRVQELAERQEPNDEAGSGEGGEAAGRQLLAVQENAVGESNQGPWQRRFGGNPK